MITERKQENFTRKMWKWLRENGERLELNEVISFTYNNQVCTVKNLGEGSYEYCFFYDDSVINL